MESHQPRGEKSHQPRGEKSHQPKGRSSHLRRSENHQQHERIIAYSKLMVTICVFVTALCFAYASFVSSACVDDKSRCLDTQHGFLSKLYFSENSAQYAMLKQEFSDQSKSFEFMVWERERASLSRSLLSMQYQRINLRPLNDELWLELNYLNDNARVPHEERSWALDRSEEVVGWNHEQSAVLVYHCVNEFEVYGQLTTASCIRNLVHLPASQTLSRMAKKTKLSAERIERARSEALKSQLIEAP